jgi:hypothetical protein
MPPWPDFAPAAADGKKRCGWCGEDPLYVRYHDEEWGVPVTEDQKLFEFLILEGAQAGLSWITILRRREGYRRAFAGFNAERVARFGAADVRRLLADEGIIRNRLKVASAIANARAFLDVQKESAPRHARHPADVAGVRRLEQGHEEARLHVRRLHDPVRAHAGHRHGQRSSGGLLPQPGDRAVPGGALRPPPSVLQ